MSLARAEQTGRFASSQDEAQPPRYSRAAIARALGGIAHRQARWRTWFARNGLSPLRLDYEDVVADPQGAAEAIGALVGLDRPPCCDPGAVNTAVQRDGLTQEWRQRFLSESHDLSRLDVPIRLEVRLRRLRSRISR